MLKNSGLIGTGSLLIPDNQFKESIEEGNSRGRTHLVEVVVEHDGIDGVRYAETDGRALYRTDAHRILVSPRAPEALTSSQVTVSPSGITTSSNLLIQDETTNLIISSDYKKVIQKIVELAEPTSLPDISLSRQMNSGVEMNVDGSRVLVDESTERRHELESKEVEVRTGFDESRSFEVTPILRVRNHGQMDTFEGEVVGQ